MKIFPSPSFTFLFPFFPLSLLPSPSSLSLSSARDFIVVCIAVSCCDSNVRKRFRSGVQRSSCSRFEEAAEIRSAGRRTQLVITKHFGISFCAFLNSQEACFCLFVCFFLFLFPPPSFQEFLKCCWNESCVFFTSVFFCRCSRICRHRIKFCSESEMWKLQYVSGLQQLRCYEVQISDEVQIIKSLKSVSMMPDRSTFLLGAYIRSYAFCFLCFIALRFVLFPRLCRSAGSR